MGIAIADTTYTYFTDSIFHTLYVASALIIGGSGIEAIKLLKQKLPDRQGEI